MRTYRLVNPKNFDVHRSRNVEFDEAMEGPSPSQTSGEGMSK
jgi:hypothetical protein